MHFSCFFSLNKYEERGDKDEKNEKNTGPKWNIFLKRLEERGAVLKSWSIVAGATYAAIFTFIHVMKTLISP